MTSIPLPELGENIETVTVSTVLVAEGDAVRKDQPVVEVETEKASLEVPATVAGRVAKIHVRAGDSVRVGAALMEIESGEASEDKPAAPEAAPAEPEPEPAPEPPGERPAEPARPATPEKSEPAGSDEHEAPSPAAARERKLRELGDPVPAAPSVRRLARELGLELHGVSGSGPGGRIGRDDVVRLAKQVIAGTGGPAQAAPGASVESPALPDFSSFGQIERKPMSALRRAAADGLSRSWSLIPHVTQNDRADVTELDAFRKRHARLAESAGAKLTVTAMLLKVVAIALRRFPNFNASLDVASREIVYKHYVHVGVAVDTDRGLLVPVIRDADRKSVLAIATELADLAARARDKKLLPDEMRGACFTVSNLGGLGTTTFTPIVNWPEVAILGVGRSNTEPVWRDDGFEPRSILPLSLSYDHRAVDGADAARFLRFVAESLENPMRMHLED